MGKSDKPTEYHYIVRVDGEIRWYIPGPPVSRALRNPETDTFEERVIAQAESIAKRLGGTYEKVFHVL